MVGGDKKAYEIVNPYLSNGHQREYMGNAGAGTGMSY